MLLNSGMPKVNIDQLSEEELVELNHKLVARLAVFTADAVTCSDARYRIGNAWDFVRQDSLKS